MLNILQQFDNNKPKYYNLRTMKYASGLFYNSAIEEFIGDLENAIKANHTFQNCNKLVKFETDLRHLQEAEQMFYGCKLLTKIEVGSLDSLRNGKEMFKNSRLYTFVNDLPCLENGEGMFDCTTLESFYGALPCLENGNNMFKNCKLTPISVRCIASTLPDKANGSVITIGINLAKASSEDELLQQLNQYAKEAVFDSWEDLKKKFSDKGWNAKFLYKGNVNTPVTYSPRDRQYIAPIFAKLVEVENKKNAEFQSYDETKFYNIDYFNDACDVQGYQQFGSLQEAMEAFGVTYIEEEEV